MSHLQQSPGTVFLEGLRHVDVRETTIALTGGGGGSGAVLKANVSLDDGAIESVEVVEGGTGYTSSPDAIASGGNGSGANLNVAFGGGKVTRVDVIARGVGYPTGDYGSLDGGAFIVVAYEAGVIKYHPTLPQHTAPEEDTIEAADVPAMVGIGEGANFLPVLCSVIYSEGTTVTDLLIGLPAS